MKKYSLGNHIGYLLKGIWESDRRLMALLVIETICSVITPYIAMYLPKIGVDLATGGASVRRAAALCLLMYLFTVCLGPLVGNRYSFCMMTGAPLLIGLLLAPRAHNLPETGKPVCRR